MILRCLLAVSGILSLSACVTVTDIQGSERAEVSQHIGWVHANCLAIQNKDLQPGDRLTLHSADRQGLTQVARIATRTRDAQSCMPLRPDRRDINLLTGATFYLINASNAPELAVATTSGAPGGLDYRYCFGNKGVTFMGSDGATRIWEGYYFTAAPQPQACSK